MCSKSDDSKQVGWKLCAIYYILYYPWIRCNKILWNTCIFKPCFNILLHTQSQRWEYLGYITLDRSLQATQIVKQQRNDYRCGKNGSAFRNWPRSLLKMPVKSIEIIEGKNAKIFRFANAIYLITRKNVILCLQATISHMQCNADAMYDCFVDRTFSHKRT